jgi:hypothetical protein
MVAIPTAAEATINVNIGQVGGDVVATVSGTMDLTGLTNVGEFYLVTGVEGDIAYVASGQEGATVDGYSGLSGPAQFGTGTFFAADSVLGDLFGWNGNYGGAQYLFLATDYAGSALSSSATWTGQTIASLGLTPGTYTYTSNYDSLVINIGEGGVPEPATWAMMLLGFGAVGWALRRKRRPARARQFA